MAKTSGLTSNPLGRRGGARRPSLGVVGALQEASSSPMVALEDIAPNPENPLERITDSGELQDLAHSIREVGVLSPVTLLPAALFLQSHPEHAEVVGDRPWVLHAGARRWAASRMAGQTHIPGHVRHDLLDTNLSMIHENTHRQAFTPMQDAFAYQRVLTDKGWSQRQLAERTKIPQGQISKRLSLLTLPEPLQQLVAADRIQLAHAYALAQDQDDVKERVSKLVQDYDEDDHVDVVALGRQARRELTYERRLEAAREAARTHEVDLVEEPEQVWGRSVTTRELSSEEDIAAAREGGSLRVAPALPGTEPEQVRFFRDGDVPEPIGGETRSPEHQRKADERGRREANAARAAALVDIVSRPPSPTVMHDAVLEMVLRGVGVSADLARIAVPLGRAAGVTTTEESKAYYEWIEELPALSKRAGLIAGWVISVAAKEMGARSPHSPWGPRQVAYLDWLAEHGYTPTRWEQTQLAGPHTDSTESPTLEEDR